jgi:hypothetical protein
LDLVAVSRKQTVKQQGAGIRPSLIASKYPASFEVYIHKNSPMIQISVLYQTLYIPSISLTEQGSSFATNADSEKMAENRNIPASNQLFL